MTTSIATGTDYEVPPSTTTAAAVDEHQQEQNNVENNEKVEETNNQQQEEKIIQAPSTSPDHIDEHVQEDDILVEENVTPFYMNTGILIK
jgi:hypothetical protein